jgi:hypothetical protein
MRLLSLMLVSALFLLSLGCGGQGSYKDRKVDVNAPENAAPTTIAAPGGGGPAK